MQAPFYVYVHRRNDTGAPFYVGKGKGARLRVTQHRNPFWKRVAEKAGWSASVVLRDLDEELAHLAEMELIAKYRAIGVRLTNLTDGGEGLSGYKRSPESIEASVKNRRGVKRPDVSARMKGIPKSAEHRANLSAAKIGRKASEEARRAMSESRKGRPSTMLGKKHRPETIEKIRQAGIGEKNPFFGKTHSQEVVDRIREANIGRKHSEETRARMSASRSGDKHVNFGKPVPADRKAKQAATLKETLRRLSANCPHCGKLVDPCNGKRWHFDNCKEKF